MLLIELFNSTVIRFRAKHIDSFQSYQMNKINIVKKAKICLRKKGISV